jgi:hypothetical protein
MPNASTVIMKWAILNNKFHYYFLAYDQEKWFIDLYIREIHPDGQPIPEWWSGSPEELKDIRILLPERGYTEIPVDDTMFEICREDPGLCLTLLTL